MLGSEREYDVAILGGGIAGAATAEALARRGRRTLLVERFTPAHLGGSSHGDGRILRYAYEEEIYVEMARLAYPGWARLATATGETLVETTGSLDCGPVDSPILAGLKASFERFALPYERLTPAAVADRFPQLQLGDGSAALYQRDGAVVRAGRAVAALWRLASRHGAHLLQNEAIVEIDPSGAEVQLRAASGRKWRAGRLVIAAGSWSERFLSGLGLALPLRATQEQVAYFPTVPGVDHGLGALPTVIDYHTENPFYALPQIDIAGVKVGWHRTGQELDPERPLPWNTANLEAVTAFVRRRFPALVPEPIHRATCLYTNTPDHHFVLDRHPQLPQVVIGTGFSGHGFKFGPVIGEILAALALDEPPPLPLETFRADRFPPS